MVVLRAVDEWLRCGMRFAGVSVARTRLRVRAKGRLQTETETGGICRLCRFFARLRV